MTSNMYGDSEISNDEMQNFKNDVKEGNYDEMKNNQQVYNSPNGMRIKIGDQEGADLLSAGSIDISSQEIPEISKTPLQSEAFKSNERANEGFKPLTPLSQTGQDFFTKEESISEEAKADARHKEALESNEKANEGFEPKTSLSQTGQDFFAKEESISEEAKADARHKEALESNEKANEGFKPLTPLSQTGQDFFTKEESISEDLKGKNFKDSLSELMTEEEATRYLKFFGEEDLTTPPTHEENEIENKLEQINNSIEETNKKLGEINNKITDLLAGQELSTLSQEKMMEYIKLMQEQMLLMQEEWRMEKDKDKTVYTQLLNQILGKLDSTPQPTTQPELTPELQPSIEPQPTLTTQPLPQQPIPGATTTIIENERIRNLEDQLRTVRGENTWEQMSADYNKDLEELNQVLETRPLTDTEKIQYFNLMQQKKDIDKQINNIEQENQRYRARKEKWIKITAGVVGASIALATPAVGVAAVIGVVFGGKLIGKGLKKWEGNLRSKSNSMKYESRVGKTITELTEFDRKQKRKELWSNRLGEASAVVIGGSVGYGLGSAVQNLFGWGNTVPNSGAESQVSNAQQSPTAEPSPIPEGSIEPQPIPEGHIELPNMGGANNDNFLTDNWLRTRELGWDTSKWGWKGPDLFVPQGNVVPGAAPDLQGQFLRELTNLGINKTSLMGQQAGDIFNQGLMDAAYRGKNLQEVARVTAEALKNLQP